MPSRLQESPCYCCLKIKKEILTKSFYSSVVHFYSRIIHARHRSPEIAVPCASHVVDVSVFLSAGSLCFRTHLDFHSLYHYLLLFLISSIFLLPSLTVVFMLCLFLLILSYCPLLLYIFHTTYVQKSFLGFYNLCWSYKNMKFNLNFLWPFLSFPRKALFCHTFSFLFSAVNVINFTLMCLVFHTSFLQVVVRIHIHIPCDLESQELGVGASHSLCSKRLSMQICAKAYFRALHSSS